MNIGVLALQGAFIEHIDSLNRLGVSGTPVRRAQQMDGLDGLIIPGGESTTILKLMQLYALEEPIRRLAAEGKPILGTCAGMIVLAEATPGYKMEPLGLMDISIHRNAFGRQIDSFETDLAVADIEGPPFHAIFIRAPVVEEAGPSVRILARLDNGTIVAARQRNVLGLSFHPELGNDLRLHRYFLQMKAAEAASCPPAI